MASERKNDPVAVVAGQVEGVHPDPVAEQRTAALAAGGVDREDGDPQLVLLVDPEPPQQLVGEARLAGAAGAGDAEHGHVAGGVLQGVEHVGGQPALLGPGDRAGHRGPVAGEHLLGGDGAVGPQVDVAVLHDGVDHPGQPEPLTVLGGEDRDAGSPQPLDLVVHDDAAATADHPHVRRAGLLQQLDEVLEVLDVPALVRRHRDAVDVLLERGVDHLLHRPVVPEVHDLAALALEDPPHDVDRGVVAVEQARRRHQADVVLRLVEVAHGVVPRKIVGCPSN